jgi:hypothetical protein
MPPLIPYQFDPLASEYEEHHLVWEDALGGHMVTWPVTGTRIFMPKESSDPLAEIVAGQNPRDPLTEITAGNNGLFKHFRQLGFTLGSYSEFFVSMPGAKYVCFKMGHIEVTFGDATPLAVMIFDPYHRERWFGPWDTIMSVRIVGAGPDEAELAFLNACTAYEEKFGVLPDMFPVFTVLEPDYDEPSDDEPQLFPAPPIITSLDPLRFYFNGMAQPDDIAACIYFYRTLEYFSFFTNATEMNRLRHDATTSDADFARKVLDMVSRDEKGPIFKLIATLADQAMLAAAVTDGLIKNPVANLLCEELYGFRNSIVHGKFNYGYSLQSGSVLEEDPIIPKWKAILRKLARLALDRYGARKI